jgi:hypothetical protein
MNTRIDYKVSFGRTARTLVYEDAGGTLLFAFDCSPAEKQSGKRWNLHLGKKALFQVGGKFVPSDTGTQSEQERVAAARERVVQYALSCGYNVAAE